MKKEDFDEYLKLTLQNSIYDLIIEARKLNIEQFFVYSVENYKFHTQMFGDTDIDALPENFYSLCDEFHRFINLSDTHKLKDLHDE